MKAKLIRDKGFTLEIDIECEDDARLLQRVFEDYSLDKEHVTTEDRDLVTPISDILYKEIKRCWGV